MSPTSIFAPICGPPRSPATRCCWNDSPRTCSTTPSATTCLNMARSPSPPTRSTATPSSPSRTPGRPSRPTKSRACSNPSAAWPPPPASPTPPPSPPAAAPDSDCPSCDPSPTHTVGTFTLSPGNTEDLLYGSAYPRRRTNPQGTARVSDHRGRASPGRCVVRGATEASTGDLDADGQQDHGDDDHTSQR